MASSYSSLRNGPAGYALFTAIVALAGGLLSAVFGPTITVSPLVLFAVAVMPNFIVYLLPAKDGDESGMFSRVFFLRVGASSACALIFYLIYRVAYSVGA